MPNDAELLRQYVADGSEAAFKELVDRHIELVYYAALRQLRGDSHQAKDTSQMVFVLLAQKAPALCHHPSLVGWLHVTTGRKVSETIRAERRRRLREEEVSAIQEIQAGSPGEADWERIRPALDEVLRKLKDRDREAVLLHFFEGWTFQEIGTCLVLTEAAAQKRVARALEKLRGLLARRGVLSSAAALAAVLTRQTTLAAPAGLSTTIAGAATAALAGGFAPLAPLELATSRFFMATAKLKIAVATFVAASAVGILIVYQNNQRRDLQKELRGLQAEHRRLVSQAQGIPASGGSALAASADAEAKAVTLLRQLAARKSRSPGSAPGPLLPGMKRVTDAANVGRATPRATIESLVWAMSHGEMDALTPMVILNPEAKSAATALFASLPADMQSQFQSPEYMMALWTAATFSPKFSGYEVVQDDQVQDENGASPGNWFVSVLVQREDGQTMAVALRLQQAADNWQLVLGPPNVQALAHRLDGPLPQ